MMLVIGSGVAGLACALAAVRAGAEVALVTPGSLRAELGGAGGAGVAGGNAGGVAGGNTALAQGGIAAAIGPGDHVDAHAADTVAAGAGLVDRDAAAILAREGAEAVRALLAAGFAVDRGADGAPQMGLEAAHGRPRIVHAGGDRTGAILHAFLSSSVLSAVAAGRIELLEYRSAVSLVTRDGAVTGAVLQRRGETDGRGLGPCDFPGPGVGAPDRALETRSADAVVIATGGYAALYPRTSNHSGARGEGIVLAARAGAAVADLEFVQFHPTVLAGTGELISEAVRGAGARLLDGAGRRFMVDRHPRAELAPRDVVSREIHRVVSARGDSCVWLDATGIERSGGAGTLLKRFPGISAAVSTHGYDWSRDPIPVSPAAHYTMGGVLSDLDGRSSVPGLYVVGEAAATGVHGGNRLASNSLLEGLVFGARAARAAADPERGSWELRGDGARELLEAAQLAMVNTRGVFDARETERGGTELAAAFADGLGIERDAESLALSGRVIAQHSGAEAELATMIHAAASARTESRGAHQRRDFPDSDPAQATRRAFRFVSASSNPSPMAQYLRSMSSC